MRYLLVDPTATRLSGISTYTRLAQQLLSADGLTTHAITRQEGEGEDNFDRRVVRAAADYDWLEIPESSALPALLPVTTRIHLRLHGSRFLGAQLERGSGPEDDRQRELANVRRATLISSPSRAGLRLANAVYPVPACHVHPNPVAVAVTAPAVRDLDVLFLGRFQELKGTVFLARIIAGLPAQLRILLAGRGCSDWVLAHGLEQAVQVLESPHGEGRMELYRRAKVVVVPSLYETFSYVVCEALAAGAQVVAWEGFGIHEWLKDPALHAIPQGEIAQFVARILDAASRPRAPATDALPTLNRDFVAGVRALLAGRSEAVRFDHPYQLPEAGHDTVFAAWKQRLADDASLKPEIVLQRAALNHWTSAAPA